MLDLKEKRRSQQIYRRIAFRNAGIVFVAFILLLAGSELFLFVSTFSEQKAANSMENESLEIVLMNIQKDLPENVVTVSIFPEYVEAIEKQLKTKIVPAAYPLQKSINDNRVYDNNTSNIVVFGDSFVWGQGCLNRNEMFWSLLENDFRSQGYNCHFIPVAMSGANAYEELAWLTDTSLVKELHPSMVIFGYTYNDAVPLDGRETKELTDEEINTVFPFFAPMRKLLPCLSDRLLTYICARTLYTRKYGLEDWGDGFTSLVGKTYEEYVSYFAEPLERYAETADFPIVIMTLPNQPHSTLLKALYAPLEEIYHACDNVTFYDSLSAFNHSFAALKHRKNYYVNAADQHPGSATNRFYADYIEQFIKKDYPEVLGERQEISLIENDFRINDWMPGDLDLKETARKGNTVSYTFSYPSETKEYFFGSRAFQSYFLESPIGEKYVKLSFSRPIDLASVSVEGESIENITLYMTCLNEKLRYDDHTVKAFGRKSEDGRSWIDSSDAMVTSLCIHADMKNRDGGTITVTVRAEDAS